MPVAVCAVQVNRNTNTFLSQLLYRQNCVVAGARVVVGAWVVGGTGGRTWVVMAEWVVVRNTSGGEVQDIGGTGSGGGSGLGDRGGGGDAVWGPWVRAFGKVKMRPGTWQVL